VFALFARFSAVASTAACMLVFTELPWL